MPRALGVFSGGGTHCPVKHQDRGQGGGAAAASTQLTVLSNIKHVRPQSSSARLVSPGVQDRGQG